MRVLRPGDGIVAFYDGRVEGYRFAEELNWVDDGALGLGIASYAIVDGDEALVYDTHVSVEHARFVRETLEAAGVTRFVVVLSHKHLDHIAGTEVFADCEVVATRLTAEALAAAGRHRGRDPGGPPAIDPLVLPTRTFEDRMTLDVGRRRVELIHVDIHSDDAAVLWLPASACCSPATRSRTPSPTSPSPRPRPPPRRARRARRPRTPIASCPTTATPTSSPRGGYPQGLIDATRDYLHILQRCAAEPELRATPLPELVAELVAAGWLTYYAPYEEVHRENLAAVAAALPLADRCAY